MVRLLFALLALPPLSLTREQAKSFVRLHGFRRVFSVLARFLSAELNLSVESRNELGRWKVQSGEGGGGTRHSAMPNVYSSDAARSRCVDVRATVAAAARRH